MKKKVVGGIIAAVIIVAAGILIHLQMEGYFGPSDGTVINFISKNYFGGSFHKNFEVKKITVVKKVMDYDMECDPYYCFDATADITVRYKTNYELSYWGQYFGILGNFAGGFPAKPGRIGTVATYPISVQLIKYRGKWIQRPF